MRVGIVGFGFGLGATGGTQVYARELLKALEASAAPDFAYVLLLHPSDAAPPLGAGGTVSAVRLEWPNGRPVSGWRQRLQKALPAPPRLPALSDPFSTGIDRLELDVVHYPATRMAELTLRTPAVLTFFDMQEEFLSGFFSFRERFARSIQNRRAIARAKRIIAPSAFTARSLTERYGVASDRIATVPVGVAPRFTPRVGEGERQRLRERYGLPDEDFLVYPANPWPHKNHRRLLAALTLVRRRLGRDVRLVCCGRLEGESRSVADMAAAAGVGDGIVHDLGFLAEEDLPALYRCARMMVFPSLFEGFGMPVLEAMACGCAVACSRTTSLPEVGGDAARLFDPTDEESMAEAVAEVWSDSTRRAHMSAKGLDRAAGYRWSRVIPRILDVYRRAAGDCRG